MPASILLVLLFLCGWSPVVADLQVTSFYWFHNSKDFCLSLSPSTPDGAGTMFTVESATLTFSYGKDSTIATVPTGDHNCHGDKKPSNYVCGFIPNGITKYDKIKPKLFEAEIQFIGKHANQQGRRNVSINLGHLDVSSAETSSLSLRDPCSLYEGVCDNCTRSCYFLYRGMNVIECDGNRMTTKVRKSVSVIIKDELPYLMERERIVDVTNRKIICVVMKRPIHRLGNVWRYLRYISTSFIIVYIDETNKSHILNIFQSNACKNIKPMEKESDTASYCNFYTHKPKYVIGITAGLGVEAHNVRAEKYVMSPQNINIKSMNVSLHQVNVPDACKDISCSPGSHCIQSCHQIYTGNAYYCNTTNSGITRLHEATVRAQSLTTTTTTLVLAGKGENDRDNLHTTTQSISPRSDETTTSSQLFFLSEEEDGSVIDQRLLFSSFIPENDEMEGKDEEAITRTNANVEEKGGKSKAIGVKSSSSDDDDSTTGPHESGEMDENYTKSEYSTFTYADVETKGKILGGKGENSVNSSKTRQPDTSEINGSIIKTSTKTYSTVGKGMHKQSTVGTTNNVREGKRQRGNSADISSTKGHKPFFYSNAARTRRACFPLMNTFLILHMFRMFYHDLYFMMMFFL
jgi:hypothetical protein